MLPLYARTAACKEAVAPQIAAGTPLQMLSGVTLDGHIAPVGFPAPGSKLLIITFSPGCPACQANQEGWMRLAKTLQPRGVRVLWVSRDTIDVTQEYCLKHGIPLIEVVADPPFRTYAQLGLARVPNTILVGPGGTVEKVWAGRLDQSGWATIFAYFGERQDAASASQSAFGAIKGRCGPELSGASAENCK